jgi:threonine/homoserine/homoserine lactone efflux protein
VDPSRGEPTLAGPRAFRQGLVSNLGNPKMVVFFSSLLPQFAPVDGSSLVPMLGLGFVFCSMTLLWLTAYATVQAKAGAALQSPAIRRTLDVVTGAIIVALGLRLATEPA